MTNLFQDSRFRLIIFANIAASIGSGITMIAIPWLLVTSENGEAVFGYVALCMTILSFILTPFVGHLIDSMSRKRILLSSQMVSLMILLIFSVMGLVGASYETWHYMIIYMIGSLYYTFFYPTMFALNQEIFSKEQYNSLNGTMEIQGQLSSMIAGGVASLLLTKWDLHYILLMNVCTYAVAIYFYLKLPYKKQNTRVKKRVVKTRGAEGIKYLWKRPVLFIFLLFSTMPFIGVMMTNYLFPVYLKDVLQVSGSIYALENMIYAIGAVTAGAMIPIIAKKMGNEKTIIVSVVLYTIVISLIIHVNLPIYLTIMFFLAIGNSGARVARNSFIMEWVPNDIIGRVDSVFRSIGLLLRVFLLAIFTGMVSSGFILYCFIVLSGVLVIASISVSVTWKKGFETDRKVSKRDNLRVNNRDQLA
ncbi:MFS transporter [Sporosarcina sp. ACRSL]|uniref:MFS transporter n=1 Tax=Sporosarcina sp. ACRSL TaxID=2918215 RepID=UPI001EF40F47|nr:MFS transporter [Sporosarcina sp. ACRSL]MCG7343746.1 MFS transporter [Sporosarcina sp. ACRSL]